MSAIWGFAAAAGCTGDSRCPLGVEIRELPFLRGIRFVVIDHSARHHGRIIWGRGPAQAFARELAETA